jgi:phosphoribosylanthranilate isomerase
VPQLVVRVGLFVDPDDALLAERVGTGALDMLQLHGSETPERVTEIKARTKKLVMKVIKVGKASDVEQGIKRYARVVDLLMFDTDGGKLPGGNAKSFDWTVLSGRSVPVPSRQRAGSNPSSEFAPSSPRRTRSRGTTHEDRTAAQGTGHLARHTDPADGELR